jgi:hypothetical protein
VTFGEDNLQTQNTYELGERGAFTLRGGDLERRSAVDGVETFFMGMAAGRLDPVKPHASDPFAGRRKSEVCPAFGLKEARLRGSSTAP